MGCFTMCYGNRDPIWREPLSCTAWRSGAEEWCEPPCVPRRHTASGPLQNQKKTPDAEIPASLLRQKKVLVAETTVLFL